MEKLFGLEMASIAGSLSAILVLVIVSLALLAWRRPVFFKLGLRPIPRRRAQSTLIVLGLMLATLIITAAFVTGDTLSHSIRTMAIEGMGEMDEMIRIGGGAQSFGSESVVDTYFKMARYEALAAQLAGYPLVDHLLPAISESAPVVNVTHRRSLRSIEHHGAAPGGYLGAAPGGDHRPRRPAAAAGGPGHERSLPQRRRSRSPGRRARRHAGVIRRLTPQGLHRPRHRRPGRRPAPAASTCARPRGCSTSAARST